MLALRVIIRSTDTLQWGDVVGPKCDHKQHKTAHSGGLIVTLVCMYNKLVCMYNKLVCVYNKLVCVYNKLVCVYNKLVCVYNKLVCVYNNACSLLCRLP